jgi:hypothetical protein
MSNMLVLIMVYFSTLHFIFRLEYDEFVKEFAKHLVLQFGDRLDTYITSAIQANSQAFHSSDALHFLSVLIFVYMKIELIPQPFL